MSGDKRSVGELIAANDALARSLLGGAVDYLDARPLMRSWPDLASAANQLWDAMPERPGTPLYDAHAVREVTRMASGVAKSMWQGRGNHYPGVGPGDARLDEMTANFDRAAQLVENAVQRDGLTAHRQPEGADLEAAQTRTLHALYVATHGVGMALRDEQRYLARPDVQRQMINKNLPDVVGGLRERFASAERVLSSHLSGRWPGRVEGEHREAPAAGHGTERLKEAFARWDLAAHRALSHSPTPSVAYVVSNTEGAMMRAGQALIGAAAIKDHVDPQQYHDRLEPALASAGARYDAASGLWQRLRPMDATVDKNLVVAAREVAAALRELTRDGAIHAGPDLIAERADLRGISQIMQTALAASAEIAASLQDVARQEDLAAPAKWIHKEAHEAQLLHSPLERDQIDRGWTTAEQLRVNAQSPLPDVLREHIAGQMADVAESATFARDASSILEQPPAARGIPHAERAMTAQQEHLAPSMGPTP